MLRFLIGFPLMLVGMALAAVSLITGVAGTPSGQQTVSHYWVLVPFASALCLTISYLLSDQYKS
jgi:hypothetical protein